MEANLRIGTTFVYSGQYQLSLDDKGRIILPRRVRSAMDVLGHAIWYMTKGFDTSIFMFHHDSWKCLLESYAKRPLMDAASVDISRLLLGSMVEAKPDAQGRMVVPAHLREHAGIEGEAILIGGGARLELWSPEGWRKYLEATEPKYRELAAVLAEEKPAGARAGA